MPRSMSIIRSSDQSDPCDSWSTLNYRPLLRPILFTRDTKRHVAELGLVSARDREIWDHATAQDAVIVTKDEDFVTMRALRPEGPPIVWIRIGNVTKLSLLRRFAAAFPAILIALERGETVQIPDD